MVFKHSSSSSSSIFKSLISKWALNFTGQEDNSSLLPVGGTCAHCCPTVHIYRHKYFLPFCNAMNEILENLKVGVNWPSAERDEKSQSTLRKSPTAGQKTSTIIRLLKVLSTTLPPPPLPRSPPFPSLAFYSSSSSSNSSKYTVINLNVLSSLTSSRLCVAVQSSFKLPVAVFVDLVQKGAEKEQ